MHSYLRAIGFAETFTGEREVELFLDRMLNDFDHRDAVRESNEKAFLEISAKVGPNMGICMCGEMDGYGFHRQYYFPYLTGGDVTTEADVSVDKKVNGQGYSVLLEESRVGVSLIYYLQNPAKLKQESIGETLASSHITSTLAGLSLSGMILLPVKKNNTEEEMRVQRTENARRARLVSEARNGDQEAIEKLTMEEMDNFAMVSRRLKQEDVFTIVDTFFMPYGMECDIYQLMGTILFYRKVRNSYSGEYVYQLTLECNELLFDVCINERDLTGDPEVGRRFKGHVWMQGKLNFTR